MSQDNNFVQDLISSIGGEVQEPKPELETPEPQPVKSQEPEVKSEPEKPQTVITEEFARENNLPDFMVGKPLKELAKSYKLLEKQFTKVTQELSSVKKAKAEEPAPKQVEEELDIPDPADYEDSASYKKAMKVYESKLSAKIKQETLAEVQRGSQEINEMVNQRKIEAIREAIQAQLPEGADASQVIQDYVADNEEQLQDLQPVYARNPNLLVKHVITHFKATNKPKNDSVTQAVKKIATAPVKDGYSKQRVSAEPTKKSFVAELADDVERYARQSDPYLFKNSS